VRVRSWLGMVASLLRRGGMAPRKRKSNEQVNPNWKRMKLLGAAETTQERQARLEQNMRNAESRAAETPQQREARLEQRRIRTAESRAAETNEQRESRLEKARTRTERDRDRPTP
jgi:hypothetical protein